MRNKILSSTKILFVSSLFLLIFFVLPQFVHGSSYLAGANSDVGVYIDYPMFAVDDTADANDADAPGDVQWVEGSADTRTSYIGHQTLKFNKVIVDVDTATTDVGQNLTMEYWNGSAWADLTLLAETHPFDTTGVNSFSFTPPTDWETTTVNGTTAYFIRTRFMGCFAGIGCHGFLGAVLSQISLVTVAVPTTHYAPHIITYQGKLMENNMSVSTTKAFGFLLYDSLTGGDLLYTASGTLASTSTINITPTQGIFSVDLGTDLTNDLSSSVFQNYSNLFLEVWVGGNKLTPRKQLVAAPFAMNSQLLLGLTATSTSSSLYIPHSDVNGNFLFTGTPQSSGVSGGVLYVNPGSADVDKTLFGIAVAGAEKFRVDSDGDVWINGGLSVTSTLSVLGFSSFATTTMNGDLTVNGTNVWLNGATMVSSSLSVLGLSSLATTTLTGNFFVDGDNIWLRGATSVSSSLSVLGQTSLSTTTFNGDVLAAGNNVWINGAAHVSSSLLVEGLSSLATTTLTGDFTVEGDHIWLRGDTNVTSSLSVLGRSNLATTTMSGDLTVNGTNVWLNGATTVSGSLAVTGNTSAATTTLIGDLTVGDGGVFALYVDKINSRVGIGTNAPLYPLSVVGQSYFSATSTIQDIDVLDGIVLGGVKRSTWSNADVVLAADNAFTGLNTFAATTTLSTTTINNLLNVGNGTLYADSLTGRVGINSSTPGFGLSVNGTSYFSGDSTLTGSTSLVTTTINGALNVGNGTLYTDVYNHRVGINSSTPGYGLSVNGDSYFGATSTFDGVSNFYGRTKNPYILGSLTNSNLGGATAVTVRGKYAYVTAATSDAFQIIDVSNPNNMVTVGTITNGTNGIQLDYPSGVFVSGNYAYVASRNSDSVCAIDISIPTNPTYISCVDNGGQFALNNPINLFISGNYAYVASAYSSALEILDISNPWNMRHVGKYVNPTAGSGLVGVRNVFVSGKYAYVVADGDNGATYTGSVFSIIDVSDPVSPKRLSYITSNTNGVSVNIPTGIYVSGRYAYVASFMGSALDIIDISNPYAPTGASSFLDTQGGAVLSGPSIVMVSGNYAYISVSTSGALEIVDVSSSTRPLHFSSISDTSLVGANSVFLSNNKAFLAVGGASNKLVAVDIQGINTPNAEIGTLSTNGVSVSDFLSVEGSAYIKNGLSIGNNGLALGGDFSMNTNTTTVNATNTLSFANTVRFLSIATTTRSNLFIFDTVNNYPNSASSTYLMSVRNNGRKAFSISSNGDVSASGTLYADSASIGTPGSPGDLAERVDIAGDDFVEPGDVVVVDPNNSDSYRRSTGPFEQAVAGVISTNPSLVIGFGKTKSTAVLAMVGRVPIKVSTENGPIHRGDVLVTASSTGYAMKYDSSKDDGTKVIGIIGVALESLESGSGKVMGLIRTGYVNNRHQTIADIQQELLKLSEAQGAAVIAPEALTVGEQNGQLTFLSNDLDVRGKTIFNVGRLVGKDENWEVDTEGRFITRLATSGGKKSLYSLQSGETEYIFSGSSHLQDGVARIDFDDVTKEIIDAEKPMKINITLTSEARGVYVGTKDGTGFVVNELQGGTSNATFDYVVIATRKGKAAQEAASQNGAAAPAPASEPVPEVAPAPAAPADPAAEVAPAPVNDAPVEVVPASEPVPEAPPVEAPPAPEPAPVDPAVPTE